MKICENTLSVPLQKPVQFGMQTKSAEAGVWEDFVKGQHRCEQAFDRGLDSQ